MLAAEGRGDITVARAVRDGGATAERFFVRTGPGEWLPESLPLAEVLAAADLVVATGRDLDAYTPATAAVTRGVPVVSVTTDSVAELVLAAGRGCVVPPRADCIVRAVLAQVDGLLPRRGTTEPDRHRQLAAVARELLGVYRHVLCASAIGGAA
jgi:glycosyltransferase involved in cell wall biosynthesis